MQADDLIWTVLDDAFCSFKTKTRTQTFCRSSDNVSGLCNRESCPLANSRYATIKEHDGKLYLYMKTAERAHSPKNLWEKVLLPRNYAAALKLVDSQLQFWPEGLVHKCKQRLTKIHQYLIRMRKLELSVRPKLVGIKKKIERRESRREDKALTAARITDSIKHELLERLKQGTYGDIYNFPQKQYEEVLDEDAESQIVSDEEEEEDFESSHEFVEAYDDDIIEEDDVEERMFRLGSILLYHTDRVVVLSNAENGTDDENVADDSPTKPLPKRKRLFISASLMQLSRFIPGKKRRSRIEVEYETESTQKQQQQLASASF